MVLLHKDIIVVLLHKDIILSKNLHPLSHQTTLWQQTVQNPLLF